MNTINKSIILAEISKTLETQNINITEFECKQSDSNMEIFIKGETQDGDERGKN